MTQNQFMTDYKVQCPSHKLLIYLHEEELLLQKLRPNPQRVLEHSLPFFLPRVLIKKVSHTKKKPNKKVSRGKIDSKFTTFTKCKEIASLQRDKIKQRVPKIHPDFQEAGYVTMIIILKITVKV